MTSRHLRSSFVLGAVFGLTAACGSTSEGGGGSGGSGGATLTGGTQSASGGMTAGGASNTGGTAGVGGAAKGTFGCPAAKPTAGAECSKVFGACAYGEDSCVCSNDVWACYTKADCPASAPAAAAACTLGGMACAYGDLNCTCSTMNGWSCQTPCPQQEPAAAAACQRPATSTCRYTAGALTQGGGAMVDSTCSCTDQKFTCFSDADCPAAAPVSAAVCDFITLDCEYPDSQCECDADGTWDCTIDCPATTPADAAACDRPAQQQCRYNAGALVQGGGMTADATCTCNAMQFNCVTQADCPATAPADAAACADLNGLACTYPDRTCDCESAGWDCTSACPAAPPAAATACFRAANQSCRYAGGALIMGGGQGTAADNTCVCLENAFTCYTAADCTAAAPVDDMACDKPGLSCAVGTQTCRCSTSSGMWSCSTTPVGNGGAGGMSSTGGAMSVAGGGAMSVAGGGAMSVAGGGATSVAGGGATSVAGGGATSVAGGGGGGTGP